MGTQSKPKAVPKLLKLDKGLKLAEEWVNNMSGPTSGEQDELEFEGRPAQGRPARLGLGARIPEKAKPEPSSDPVQRKLLGKLNAYMKNSPQNIRNTSAAEEEETSEEDDEPQSRVKAFVKKRATPTVISVQSIKRRK